MYLFQESNIIYVVFCKKGEDIINTLDKRNYLFDNLKAFLIISVIIGNSLEYVNPTSVDPHYFILFLYIFHMPMFTFVSGYFNNKSSRTAEERVIGILKIYLFAQTFYFIVNRLLGDTELKYQLLAPHWTMWYFLSLMFWYIISNFIKNKKKWLIFSLLLSLFVGFDPSVGSYVSTSRTFFFLPFFVLGMCFTEEHLEKLKKYRIVFIMGSIATLIVLYLISDYTPVDLLFEYSKYTAFFDEPLFPLLVRGFHYIGAFFVGGFILGIMPKKKTILSIIGKNSVVMYVLHALVIKLLYKYDFITYGTLFNVILSEIIIVLVAIASTLLYIKLKNIYKNKFPKRLIHKN